MKNTICLLTVLCFTLTAFAQEAPANPQQNVSIKWAPTGLILGSLSLQAEYNFGGRNSLTAKIGLPINVTHNLVYEDEKSKFSMKGTSFLAGYRTYFNKKHLRGLYYEPFFKYVHHVSEGTSTATIDYRNAVFSLMNTYSGFGVGVQFGAQFFIGKRCVIDLFFLGPEINSSSNSFKAVEVGYSMPWTSVEAENVKGDAQEFLNQFPFIRNRVNIMVDPEMKRINANFKGVLPGIRSGISIGFTF